MYPSTQLNSTQQNRNLKNNPKQQVSFNGRYQSINDDIRIKDEVVNELVSTTNGDIKVKKAEINSSINTTNGDIDINNSKVKGNISTTNGSIEVSESPVKGNISTNNGDIIADTSKIIGDIESKNGKISLTDSEIEGVTKTTPKNLELKGKNTLKDLILSEEHSGGSIHISGNGSVVSMGNISGSSICIGGGNSGIIINGKRIDLNKLSGEAEAKALEFTLPKGNKITGMLKFDSKKPGVLLLEEGAEFIGKLINGAVKHLRP